jgi:hypothetical protein
MDSKTKQAAAEQLNTQVTVSRTEKEALQADLEKTMRELGWTTDELKKTKQAAAEHLETHQAVWSAERESLKAELEQTVEDAAQKIELQRIVMVGNTLEIESLKSEIEAAKDDAEKRVSSLLDIANAEIKSLKG